MYVPRKFGLILSPRIDILPYLLMYIKGATIILQRCKNNRNKHRIVISSTAPSFCPVVLINVSVVELVGANQRYATILFRNYKTLIDINEYSV